MITTGPRARLGGPQLVVMARWPAAGRCKSRLAAGLGAGRAAAIQRQLSDHTLAVARRARERIGCQLVLAVHGLGARASRRWGLELGCDRAVAQGRGGLGLRMQRQMLRAQGEGAGRVVLIGSDLPCLESADLEAAFEALTAASLVLGPAADGGYWLIGLDRPRPGLMAGMPWGSPAVLAHTLAAARDLELSPRLLRQRHDLDRAIDLAPWR
ncbi:MULTISPECIES: TIGR04282 family arsenosugar biosynthesis glycosyltransferase [Aphanothece]|uniref:TIGR04282 family arsenosugar biosynthesis glycosyltransferase n=1 Tax=Aphanothece TaxID=1121 RepID=UPI003984A963